MTDVIGKIFEASKCDHKSLTEKALKLSEECGELAQAVLSFMEVPGCGFKGKTKEDVIEEAWDCIITAASVIYQVEDGIVNEKYSREVIDRKLTKWIQKSRMSM
jgi:NTP pyrophosphatase (non-canonical NTP hydrolase)